MAMLSWNKEGGFMKKVMLVLAVFLCFAFTDVHAQSAKDAYMALKKMQARVQAGVSYRDYGQVLKEARRPVNLYLESPEADKNPELRDSYKKIIRHYELVGMVWQDAMNNSFMQGYLTKEMERLIVKTYPKANEDYRNGGARGDDPKYDFLLKEPVFSIIWGEASEEIKKAGGLLSASEKSSQTEQISIDSLKKENELLKQENAKLKEQLSKKK